MANLFRAHAPGHPQDVFRIEELTGRKRILRLQGQSLPYRPVAWETQHRIVTTWYPGNPEASQQILGPIEEPTEIKGTWRLRKLLQDPAVLVEGYDWTNLDSPEKVRDVMDSMARSGQALRVSWGGIVRVGRIRRVKFPHHRLEDIEFEIQFEWKGRGERVPPANAHVPAPSLSLLESIFRAFANATNTINRVNGVAQDKADAVIRQARKVQSAVSRAGALVDRTITAAHGAAVLPADIINAFVNTARSIRSEVQPIVDLTSETPAEFLTGGLSTRFQPGTPGSVTDNVAELLDAYSSFHTTRYQAEQLAREARRQQDARLALLKPMYLDVVVARQGQSLRQLAIRYYGDADSWQVIADANNLASSVLVGGEIVIIPVRT